MTDSGPSGIQATIVGNPTLVANQQGNASTAYSFGSGNRIVLTDSVWDTIFSVSGSGGFSMSAWVRPTAYADDEAMTIVGQAYGSSMFWGIAQNGYTILRMDDSSKTAYSSTAVPLNEWHHLVVTYDAGAGRPATYYINGVFDGTVPVSDGTIVSHSHLYIGYQQRTDSGANSPFYGSISDVHIYNKVLTPQEVNYLYSSTK